MVIADQKIFECKSDYSTSDKEFYFEIFKRAPGNYYMDFKSISPSAEIVERKIDLTSHKGWAEDTWGSREDVDYSKTFQLSGKLMVNDIDVYEIVVNRLLDRRYDEAYFVHATNGIVPASFSCKVIYDDLWEE